MNKVGRKIISWEPDGSEDEFSWTDFCENLNPVINKKSPTGTWFATVENFGWDNRNGTKIFKAETAEQFFSQILPKCECTFKVFNYGKGLAVQNYHHDSPTGNEWYYIIPKKLEDE